MSPEKITVAQGVDILVAVLARDPVVLGALERTVRDLPAADLVAVSRDGADLAQALEHSDLTEPQRAEVLRTLIRIARVEVQRRAPEPQ